MSKHEYVRDIPLKTKTLSLYDKEPYFSNAINSMAKKNWVLVSKKRVQQEFSFKTIVECTFSKKKCLSLEIRI